MRISLFVILLFTVQIINLTGQSRDFNIDFRDQVISPAFPVQTSSNSELFQCFSAYHFEHSEKIQLAYRLQNEGVWSAWEDLKDFHEVNHKRKVVIGSAFSKRFEMVQFRSNKRMKSPVNFRLFQKNISLHSSTDPTTYRPISNQKKSGTCDPPNICDRSCWCPDASCPEDSTPAFTNPSHLIIHHSAGNNNSNDFSAVVAFYYDFHVNTNGWDDIGYNWLIDPNGVIYEGRGLDKLGAHFSCMNRNTAGICLIGDFTSLSPSEKAIDAAAELCAWLGDKYQIDVLDQSYHPSSTLELYNISSHRDGNDSPNGCTTTACPGAALYVHLQDIREKAASVPCYNEGPDLIISNSFLSPNNFAPGEETEWIVQLENKGQLQASDIKLEFYINANLINEMQIDSLDVNLSTSVSFNTTLFDEMINYDFCVIADTLNNENISSNNSKCSSINFEVSNTNLDAGLNLIYPNPFFERFYIETDQTPSSIEIYNTYGHTIPFTIKGKEVYIEHQINGIYLISVGFSNSSRFTQKIVKL